jgi:hypothetical protein
MRSMWPRYLKEDCDAVVFVFDVSMPPDRPVPSEAISNTAMTSAARSGTGAAASAQPDDGLRSQEELLEAARLALGQ